MTITAVTAAIKTALGIANPLLGAITWKLIADTAAAVLGRIQWTVVLERLLTRLSVHLLRWIAKLSTNDLVDDTVELIINMLEQQRLPKAAEGRNGNGGEGK
jgi:hypothetical protein